MVEAIVRAAATKATVQQKGNSHFFPSKALIRWHKSRRKLSVAMVETPERMDWGTVDAEVYKTGMKTEKTLKPSD